jgi:hypothetical protein
MKAYVEVMVPVFTSTLEGGGGVSGQLQAPLPWKQPLIPIG